MPTIRVKLGSRSYPIVVGSAIEARLGQLVKRALRSNRLFVCYDAGFYALHGDHVQSILKPTVTSIFELVIPGEERSKSPATLQKIYQFLLDHRIARSDFILACGGGVLSDLSGFAAATILRGIQWAVVPTTLLGMVDAAIGGKTGINHRTGKNLVGAFWQPSFVLCDCHWLQTLPARQLVSGLGEVLKYAGLVGSPAMEQLQRYLSFNDMYHLPGLVRLVGLSARYKASIVTRDEREGRLRMLLNLGHTIGHGIEHATGYGRLLHGESVILGLHTAIVLSSRLNPARTRRLAEYRRLAEQCMTLLPKRKIGQEKIMNAIKLDKKRSSSGNTFILLDAPGKPLIVDSISMNQVRKALAETLSTYQDC
ncbi:MAG: 3-dehydroquinate synthase [Candidatus Zixiibacteriota bacterium]